MMKPARFVVIGLGGYGLVHIKAVRWLAAQGRGRLAGVVALDVDRNARPQLAAELEREGVVLYQSVDSFFSDGVSTADVLTVPIGIHEHVPVAARGLEAGLHVYCEKPVAATVQDVDQLIAAEHRSDRKVAVGYQHLYSASMQKLKQVLCSGQLGAVKSIELMCGWPRSVQYYSRNQWAGRLRVGDDWILDSPANNAHAHYVMNALYLASPEPHSAAIVEEVRAELWRAHRIESADTVQGHFRTGDGVEVRILVTHANIVPIGPVMHVMCERGRAYWLSDEGRATIRYADGRLEMFDNLIHEQWRFNGFRNLVDAIEGRADVICAPAVARAQTVAVDLMHESCPSIVTIPEEFVQEQEDWEMYPPDTKGIFRRITGMDCAMNVAFHERAFLSEFGHGWTTGMKSQVVKGEGYSRFPSM
jgi:predicted dehydrogenase